MSVHPSGIDRPAPSHLSPPPGEEASAWDRRGIEGLHHRFSEIDTESTRPECNRIIYLEQLLRLREPRHLSSSQLAGRRFLLDMLRLVCQLPPVQLAQAGVVEFPGRFDPRREFKYLGYLLERSGKPGLAMRIYSSRGISSLDEPDVLALREWLDSNGLDLQELAMIQPDFFRDDRMDAAADDQPKIHPMFLSLSRASRDRNHDYLAGTFFGLSQWIRFVPSGGAESKPNAGWEEAMSSIFGSPLDSKAAARARLKEFFIPSRSREPVVGLSFLQA
jgi:hypothetical protein